MKANRKGFTLIELLAVIVILAIIALIATPMILGVIDSAKRGAAESSAYGYVDSVEKSSLKDMIDNNGNTLVDDTYSISSDGKVLTANTKMEADGTTPITINVSFKGDNPKGVDDSVTIAGGEITAATLTINGYVVTYDGKKATAAR